MKLWLFIWSSVYPIKVVRTFLLLLFSLILVVAVSCGRYEYPLASKESPVATKKRGARAEWLSSMGEVIFPLIEKHDTEYAIGYREEVFRTIDLGASEARVFQRLGPPLLVRHFSDGSTYWYYTRHGKRLPSYFVRILGFDQKRSLIARYHYFYIG